MKHNKMSTRSRPPFAPNITPPRPAPAPLSTGQRAMGWLLVLTPVLAAISLAIAAALIPGHRPVWHDYPVWLAPHLFLVVCNMVINTIPAFACYWILCRLGDVAEKRGMCRRLIWPGVLLLCTLAGCELLWSIRGLWLVTYTYTTLALFGGSLYALTLTLLRSRSSIFGSRAVLHSLYIALIAINAFWFLHSLAEGNTLSHHKVFGQSSPRARRNNPLLPEHLSPWNRREYRSWLFEPHKVLQSLQQQNTP